MVGTASTRSWLPVRSALFRFNQPINALSLARPPRGGRITRRYFGRSQRDEVAALERIAPNLRAILEAHVALQFMYRGWLRSPHDVPRDGLVGVAPKAFHFEIAKPGIERIAERRRRLRRTLEVEHALVPRLDGEPIGFPARFRRPLCRRSD